jgi:hypothetical protein
MRIDGNSPKERSPWHAVEIVPPRVSCAAAQALKGIRFLSAQAPLLPLDECTQPTACRCAYRKHPDRREDARRLEDATGTRRFHPVEIERREGRGRRSTD